MSQEKITRMVVVANPNGLHARPADMIVRTATRFASKIELVKGQERVNGKSILEIMTLAAVAGTRLSIEADGPDAALALDALAELFGRNFAEEENTQS
ncbi:MAG TPA: HPr family phosphocarrier protein [Pirellulales bacterium]|jgi:phosphocarrier protein|nr:HPr family phosphocarrier protein [Pirellulales bacterium]